MTITRTLAVGLAVALCAPTVWADGDRDRGGAVQNRSDGSSSSGSTASAAGARHHGGGGSSATAHSGGGNSSGGSRAYPRGGGSTSSDTRGAAMRHPRAGTGSGWHRGGYSRGGYYGGGYYGGYYPYSGWGYWGYPSYGWYGGWGWGGYAWSTPYYRTGYYTGSGYRASGSLRVIVKPSKARVYVDGYYSGTADDFDGMFQRLGVTAGRHEIAFKLEGYRTHRVQVYVDADQTLKLRHEMVAGEGESAEDLMPPEAVLREREEKEELARIKREPHRERGARDQANDAPAVGSADAGTAVVLDVEPADASVYVDGEFRGTVGELRQVWLAPGKHRLEIVRPGFVTLDRDIEVGAEAVPLNFRLEKR